MGYRGTIEKNIFEFLEVRISSKVDFQLSSILFLLGEFCFESWMEEYIVYMRFAEYWKCAMFPEIQIVFDLTNAPSKLLFRKRISIWIKFFIERCRRAGKCWMKIFPSSRFPSSAVLYTTRSVGNPICIGEERLPSILPSQTTYLRTRVWGAWGCIRLPETRFRSFGNWISSTVGRLLIRLRLTIHIRGYDFYDFSSARLIKYFPDYFPWIVTDFEFPVLPQGENVELGYRGRHWERARTTFQKQAQRHFTLRPRVSPRRTKRQSSPQGPLAIQPR